jgi:hypothetical protein
VVKPKWPATKFEHRAKRNTSSTQIVAPQKSSAQQYISHLYKSYPPPPGECQHKNVNRLKYERIPAQKVALLWSFIGLEKIYKTGEDFPS